MQFSHSLTILGLVVLAASSPIQPLGDGNIKRQYTSPSFTSYNTPLLADVAVSNGNVKRQYKGVGFPAYAEPPLADEE